MRALIVGCGYVGMALGRRLAQQGHQVFGMRRSPEAQAEVASAGIRFVRGDISNPESFSQIEPAFDWVINLVSSSKGGIEEYRKVYVEGNRNLLRWLEAKPPKMLLYTSSTSVYAQTDGSVVTEESPAEGSSETSRLLVEAEKILLDAALDRCFPALVLRVAGIYGPGRGHMYQQFLMGQARLIGDGERLLNMIHLEDLVDLIIAALAQGRAGELYNAADDHPVPEREFYEWLATRLQRPMPPAASPEQVAARKRGLTSKRVSNEKIKAHTGYWFLYPTFREGYGKIIREEFPENQM
jgi:nucleoside-diphosphate-sugar epimerase